MLDYPRRLSLLRQRIDKTEAEVARLAGIGIDAYFDLEYHRSALIDRPSLRQVVRLAEVLGVSPLGLLSARPLGADQVPRLSFAQLAAEVCAYLPEHDLSLAGFEAQIGLSLAGFLDDPNSAWEQPLAFFQTLCRPLGIHWLQAVPPCLPAEGEITPCA